MPDAPPPVHRWPDPAWAAEYARQVRDSGWRVQDVDTELRWDKRGFLAACRRDLGFPDWFGMNWDALADCLSDLEVPPEGGLLVRWRGWGPMARMYPDDFAVATDVLAGFVTDAEARGRTVLVALVGPGPDPA